MNYHLVLLGCQMNQSDGERIASVLESMGYRACEREEDANILGVVACSVRQKSIDRVYSKIEKWNGWKHNRHLLTFVSGCVLPADHTKFLDRFDLVFGIAQLPQLPDMITQYGIATPASLSARSTGEGQSQLAADETLALTAAGTHDPTGSPSPAGLEEFWHIDPRHKSAFEAFVPIQNGCDKFCSYCAVPYTRGREVSRPSAEILTEVRDLVERGYRSITLLGQNVNSYGLDRQSRQDGGELDFTRLLEAIGEYGDRVFRESGRRFWVYFTSPHPRDMKTAVLETIARHACLGKQIHLPLQSGDDGVLARMNRQHDLARYRSIVADIRRLLPEATLFTDIITGFSGETEAEHAATRSALAEFGYNMAYIATYSPRPGAASAEWPDDIPLDTKKARLHELTEVFKTSSLQWNRNLVGRPLDALVEGPDRSGNWLQARTEGRIPVRFARPDGLDDDALIGRFVRLEITQARALSLEGRFIELETAPVVGGPVGTAHGQPTANGSF